MLSDTRCWWKGSRFGECPRDGSEPKHGAEVSEGVRAGAGGDEAAGEAGMEKVAPRIDELLEEWGPRTTAKQRITGSRLHRQLVEEGYEVGVTTVRAYLREKRRQRAEVYIPLVHRPGEEAQVDFFEVTVEEGGAFARHGSS